MAWQIVVYVHNDPARQAVLSELFVALADAEAGRNILAARYVRDNPISFKLIQSEGTVVGAMHALELDG